MAAVLCGDHVKDTYPDKLVDNMDVPRGVEYVNSAFKKFLDECEKNKQCGTDGCKICIPTAETSIEPTSRDHKVTKKTKSIGSKVFSCFACGN